MSDAAAILLVRHGQSTWNAEGRWQGSADAPLSTLGVEQARAAAQALGTFDAIASSDLSRARTTAEIIARELGIGPVEVDADVRERTAGAWEGLTKAEIDERFPGARAAGDLPRGWEPTEQVVERAVGALGRVAAAVGAGGTALVVTHGGVIKSLEVLLDVERGSWLGNLCGRWLLVGPGELRAGDEVTLLDDDLVTTPQQL